MKQPQGDARTVADLRKELEYLRGRAQINARAESPNSIVRVEKTLEEA